MEIKTHVLTNPQNLDDNRKSTARKNIGAIGNIKVSSDTRIGPVSGTDMADISNFTVPSPDAFGKILKSTAPGKYAWVEPAGVEQQQVDWDQADGTKVDYIKNKPGVFLGATENDDGVYGFVPAPKSAERDYFLCANGNWTAIPDTVRLVDEVTLESMDAVTSHAVALAVGNLTGFQVVNGTGADNHPDVAEPNTRTIYLVKVDSITVEDKYKEWIYVIPGQGQPSWECIGSTGYVPNSWKQWSEDQGSTGSASSVYLGQNNAMTRILAYALGMGNTAVTTDNTDYSGTDTVLIGSGNTATNAAYAYQFGRDNTVTGNYLVDIDEPYSVSINIGHTNSIVEEGVNIGKGNASEGFGVTLGERNLSKGGSVSIGKSMTSLWGSFAIGTYNIADSGSFAIGNRINTKWGSFSIGNDITSESGGYAFGEKLTVSNGAFAVGRGTKSNTGGISIRTSNASSASLATKHYAYGTIVVYQNPDNKKVPVTGTLQVKTGYSISAVYAYTNVVYDNVTYDYAVCNSSSEATLYKDGLEARNVDSGDIMRNNNQPNPYWRIQYNNAGSYTYTFASRSRDDASSEIRCISNIKEYFTVTCRCFYENNDLYVYANGYGYDNKSITQISINLESCLFNVAASYTGEQIGGTTGETDSLGAYNGGISVGDAHASGSSIALSTNGKLDIENYNVNIINSVELSYDGIPTNLGIRIADGSRVYANDGAVALGTGGVTASNSGVAVGLSGNYAYTGSLALGMQGNNADEGSIAIGMSSNNATDGSIAMGFFDNFATGGSVAIGAGCVAEKQGFAFGYQSKASNNSTSLGTRSYAEHNSTALGDSNVAKLGSCAFGDNSLAVNYALSVGVQNKSSNLSSAIGEHNESHDFASAFGQRNYSKDYAIAVGFSNSVTNYSTAIGHVCSATNQSFAAGQFNGANLAAIAIGTNNTSYGWSIVMGEGNNSGLTRGAHATIIGHNNINTSDKETVNWKPTLNTRSTYNLPSAAYSPYCITQQIFTPEELQYNSGIISKIAFTVDDIITDGASNVSRNLKIYLGSTSKKSFTWKPYYNNEWPGSNDWVPVNEQTLVYNGSYTFQLGKNVIDLTTTFNLPPDSNIVVTVIDNTGSIFASVSFTALSTTKIGSALCRLNSTAIDTSDLSQYYAGEFPAYDIGLPYYKSVMSFTIGSTTVSTDDIEGLTGEISTNSIIMGEKNTSNHWNSLLFGVGNTSLAPLPADIPDAEHPYDHDDGFVLAIGRENVVGRNYDIAIGYKSVANGGENIAIGNSKAVGYRNIAMVNSDIIGISNIGLMESSLTTTLPIMYYGEGKNVRNVLLHGKLNHSGPELIENIVINSGADLTNKQSCSGNVFYNVDLRSEPGYYDDHDVYRYYDTDISLSIDAYNIMDNVFWGMYTNEGGSITCRETVSKNFVINSIPTITNAKTLTNNVFLDSVVSIDNISDILSNTVIHGTIVGKNCSTSIIGNHIGTECCLNVDNNTSEALVQNFLENGSSLTAYTEDPIVNRCDGSGNVMFGAFGKGIRGCFCMGQGGMDARNGSHQYSKQQFADSITDMSMLGNEFSVTQSSLMTANFGPNPVMSTTYSVVAGQGNTAYGIHSSTVIGKTNVVGYHGDRGEYYEYPADGRGMFYADIFGESNMVFANSTFVMNTVHGGRNKVFTNVMTDSQIFGRENKIAERPVPAVMSCAQVKALQEQYEADSTIQLPTYIKMSDSGTIYEYNGSSMQRYTTSVTADYIYSYDKETAYTGEPYGINFSRVYTDGVYSDENNLEPNTSDYASEIHRLHVFGQQNWVHSYVMDYTVFGSANEITNSLAQPDPYHPFGISNGFVQGNNNVVSNGSNIVCMGNGNVSTGHNSVAIGSQLISNQWQTVVGKYNEAVSGPSRVIDEYKTTLTYELGEVVWHDGNYYKCTVPVQVAGAWDASKWTVTNPESDKAIFIVGNGYSETDGSDWQDENKIHRSNAMEVYADGTVKARRFESDSDVTLVEGDGIHISETNNQVTVAVKQSLANLETFLTANPQPQSGTYMLGSVNGAWAWIQVNTTTIGA